MKLGVTRHVAIALGASAVALAESDLIPATAGATRSSAAGQVCSHPIFGNPEFAAGDSPVSVAVGDLDGDLDLDLAVANTNSDDVSVLLNNGDGSFAPAATYGTGEFVFAEIIVPDDPNGLNTIADLDVDLIIEHTWQGDLIIELEHVDNKTRIRLMDRPGAPQDNDPFGWSSDNLGNPATGEKFFFDDEAPNPYDTPHHSPSGIENPVGPYQPDTDPLSNFDGKDKRGTWRLWVSDNAAGDQGVLLNFSLHFVNIPAPGALALLGLAGLVGTRRRRG